MAGEPAPQVAAYLLGDGNHSVRRQCRGLSALDPTGFERLEHTVEDAAVVMRMAIERRPEAATWGLSGDSKRKGLGLDNLSP